MKINFIFLKSIFLSLLLFTSFQTLAQLVGSNAFLRGKRIEVGVDDIGAFGSDVDVPAGYHARGGAGYNLKLGFVADPGDDGWTIGTPDYMGDYFVPGGVPHEGWSISVGGNMNRAWRSTGITTGTYTGIFTAPVGSTLLLTGTNTGYTVTGSEISSTWEGTMGDLEIKQVTTLDTNDFYFIVEVLVKNTGTTPAADIYYERSVDPENEQEVPGGSSTVYKEIQYEPTGAPGDDNKCLVKTYGMNFPSLSYMGLGTIDCRAQGFILQGGNYSPPAPLAQYYDGTASGLFDEGNNTTANSGCGIVFQLGTLAAGDSTTFTYAYILSEAHLDSAFAKLAPSFDVDGLGVSTADTVFGCVGDTVNISIEGGNEFDWGNWEPSVGLVFPSGRDNQAIIQDTPVTYRIVGTTFTCPENDTLYITLVPGVPPNAGTDTTIQLCGNADPVNLLSMLSGSPDPGGTWTGPGVTAGGILNPAGMAEGSYVYTYLAFDGNCYSSAKLTVQIVNDVDLDFDFVVIRGCNGDSVMFTNLTEDTLQYFRWNFGDGTLQDTTNEDATHFYTEQGEYGAWLVAIDKKGCIDSMMQLVNTLHPLHAEFEQSSDSICQSSANTIAFFDRSVGNLVSWSWDFGDGGTSALQNPTHTYTTAGTHSIRLIVTDDIPCTDTFYTTVYVDPTPYLSIDIDKDTICRGDMIRLNIDYPGHATNVTWNFGDGSVINSSDHSRTHSYADIGSYIISVMTEHPVCPELTVSDSVFVQPYPQINLGSDTALCLRGSPIYIDPAALVSNPAGTFYYWSTGDTTSLLKITEPGTYRVYADLDGCVTSDEFQVTKDCYVDIPNSFTPNGDGNNDYFFPRELLSKGVIDFTMAIYNRWGQVIFETNNPNGKGWDGKLNDKEQPVGVYIYQISVRYKNQAAEKYTGNITLLR